MRIPHILIYPFTHIQDEGGVQMKKKGIIVVFTGNGKGKTTAALGIALRASGYGMKTLMIEFIKEKGKVRRAGSVSCPR